MSQSLLSKIIGAIAIEYPFTEDEIKSLYDATKSLDVVIMTCDLATHTAITLQQARSRLSSSMKPKRKKDAA